MASTRTGTFRVADHENRRSPERRPGARLEVVSHGMGCISGVCMSTWAQRCYRAALGTERNGPVTRRHGRSFSEEQDSPPRSREEDVGDTARAEKAERLRETSPESFTAQKLPERGPPSGLHHKKLPWVRSGPRAYTDSDRSLGATETLQGRARKSFSQGPE